MDMNSELIRGQKWQQIIMIMAACKISSVFVDILGEAYRKFLLGLTGENSSRIMRSLHNLATSRKSFKFIFQSSNVVKDFTSVQFKLSVC